MFNWTFINQTQMVSNDDIGSINTNLLSTTNKMSTTIQTITNTMITYVQSTDHMQISINATKNSDISWPACFGFVILILATVGGNILVLAALYVDKRLHSPSFYLIANMAIADLLLGFAVLPFSSVLELLNDRWVFGQSLCSAWLALDVLSCTASIMALMAVSIDRYIGVTRPLNYSSIMTTRRTIYLVIIVWAVSILTSVVPLFGLTDREKRPNDSISDQEYYETCKVNKDKFYTIFSSMVSFYIPVVILLILYSRVYQEAKIQGKKLENEKRRLYELDYQIASEHVRRKQGNIVRHPSEQALDERRPMLSNTREKLANSNGIDNCQVNASISKNSNGKNSSDELTANLTIHSIDGAQLRREYLDSKERSRNDETIQSGSSLAQQFINVRRTLTQRISSPFRQNSQSNATSQGLQTPSSNTAQMSHNDELIIIKRKLNNLKREKKAFRTLGVILGALLICWLPFFVTLPAMSMLRTYGMINDENTENTWFKITFWLGYCNSALNPFVYAFSNRAIRRAFRRLLFRRYCCCNVKCWLCERFCPEKTDPYGDDNNQQFQRHKNNSFTGQNKQVTPRRTNSTLASTSRKSPNGYDSFTSKRRASVDGTVASQVVSFVESVPERMHDDTSSNDPTQSSPKLDSAPMKMTPLPSNLDY